MTAHLVLAIAIFAATLLPLRNILRRRRAGADAGDQYLFLVFLVLFAALQAAMYVDDSRAETVLSLATIAAGVAWVVVHLRRQRGGRK